MKHPTNPKLHLTALKTQNNVLENMVSPIHQIPTDMNYSVEEKKVPIKGTKKIDRFISEGIPV